MSAPRTRRAALQTGAVAISALCVPALALAAMPALDLDAEMFRLLDHWHALQDSRAAIDAAYDAASDRAKAAYPPRPEALRLRGTDALYDLGGTAHEVEGSPGGRVRFSYRHGDVMALRAAGPVTMWAVADDGEPSRRVPDPKGEARRQEIIAAYDRWSSDRKAVEDAVGHTAATAASDSWCGEANAAERAVSLCPARTLAGLARKAAWVADLLARDVHDDDLAEVFARQVAAFGGVMA